MIIDFLELFTDKDGDALTGDQASKFAIDFEQESPTTGYDEGRPVAVFALLEAAGADVTVKLQDCDTVDGTYTDCSGAVTLVDGEEGAQVAIPLPLRHKRYMQAYFAGGTSGKIKAFITSGFQDNPAFEQAPELGRNS